MTILSVKEIRELLPKRTPVSLEKRDGKEVLRVRFPKGSAAPSCGPPEGGMTCYLTPKGFPCKGASISYRIFFDEKFEWNKGGKVAFGLFVGEEGASGGRHKEDAASARIMWRPDGDAECYVYKPKGLKQDPAYDKLPNLTKNGEYGDSIWRGSFKFKKGAWNDVDLDIKLNDIGKNNGLLSLKINGKQMKYERMGWRSDKDIEVSGINSACFFGGNDKSWASRVDTFVDLTDVEYACN